MRVGIGYDSHRFADGGGRKLILGGVEIPHPQGLAGHSDADVVAHALTDAILGAAALGDIGGMFPETDPRWKDCSSLYLLDEAYRAVRARGLALAQCDLTVIAERPRLAPHVAEMRRKLATVLLVDPGVVSIKGKTNEGRGSPRSPSRCSSDGRCPLSRIPSSWPALRPDHRARGDREHPPASPGRHRRGARGVPRRARRDERLVGVPAHLGRERRVGGRRVRAGTTLWP